jgi:lipoyl(octanoyl) transferase
MGPVDFVRLMEEALIRLCGGFGVRAGRIAGLTGVWCGVDEGIGNCHPNEQRSLVGGPGREQGAGNTSQVEQNASAGPERKIGAIGIHVSRGITSHGFAFNVTTDLSDFGLIVPCGIPDHPVTSLELELERTVELPGLEAVAHKAAREFGQVFDQKVLAVESLEALRAQAAAASANMPQFPAQDTPLQVPAEVQRLRDAKGLPIQA